MIYIKSDYDITQIEKACEIWKKVKKEIINFAKVGTSLIDIDKLAKKIICDNNATPAFYNYHGFIGNICISVNDCVIHGIPTDYKIQNNDLVTFDVGVNYNNYICDAAFTVAYGNDPEIIKINNVCYDVLMESIKLIKPGTYIGDISSFIESYAKEKGYSVIRDFGGHGCGIKLHEDPIILNYGEPKTGLQLRENMIICIEPMIFNGSNEYYISSNDNWSVISKNGNLTCHWEHMVLVTENGFKILTE